MRVLRWFAIGINCAIPIMVLSVALNARTGVELFPAVLSLAFAAMNVFLILRPNV
jgi:hypothetical protein